MGEDVGGSYPVLHSRNALGVDIISSMRKYADTEGKPAVVSFEEQARIASNLHKLGKQSAVELSDEERKQVLDNSEK